MAQRGERDVIRNLKDVIKKQRKIIQSLKKSMSRTSKKQGLHEDFELQQAEAMLLEDQKEHVITSEGNCPVCSKGKMEIIDLGIRTVQFCDSCKYRKVTK